MIRRCSCLAGSDPELLLPVFWTARWRGVEPLFFTSSGSAPRSIRALTAAELRVLTARCSGATPLLSIASGSAPASMR